MKDRTPAECKAMAGEMLAWLDEKDWDDEDKASVAAGCFPVLLARLMESKEQMDRGMDYFIRLMKIGGDLAWKLKQGEPPK
jgi:hypothetical protein